nr:MAG TPA: NikA, BACTERIAL CONJUGATION, RELAXASE, DNA [Caudoviricetes sp.]
MKKIGRPKSDNPRNIRLEITLNKDENFKLIKISEILGLSKTSTIVKGLELLENELNK